MDRLHSISTSDSSRSTTVPFGSWRTLDSSGGTAIAAAVAVKGEERNQAKRHRSNALDGMEWNWVGEGIGIGIRINLFRRSSQTMSTLAYLSNFSIMVSIGSGLEFVSELSMVSWSHILALVELRMVPMGLPVRVCHQCVRACRCRTSGRSSHTGSKM